MSQRAQAERVHERIAFIAWVEIDLARDRRDAETVSVMGDAGHDAGEKPAVICNLGFAICDWGAGAFGEGGPALALTLYPRCPSPNGRERVIARGRAPGIHPVRTVPT